ncbi:MAG TPA: sigma-70 family RNA polymerase sigma factor [Fimbriiglobus sp.]
MNADDRRLITATLAGNTAAFGDLVRRHQDRLYNAVLRVVDHAEDAADVVQDAFVNAYQALGTFKGDSELYTWLYRIAYNLAISQMRKRRPVVSLDVARGSDPTADPIDHSADTRPGEALERREDEAGLFIALARLSPEHRDVLVMKDLDGQRYEEIAVVLDVPIGTVRSRLHRARLELRQILEPDGK